MNSLGDYLRRAREEQGRSLDDIASARRVNRKFFEEIERGVFTNLPQTYVRAFIRAYALEVNLDPAEALRLYEGDRRTAESISPPPSDRVPPATGGISMVGEHAQEISSQRVQNKQGKVLLIFSLLLLIGLAVTLLWIHNEQKPEPAHEIVFQEMMKDLEAKNTPLPSSVSNASDSAAATGRVDSLSLVGTALDTVWMRFAIDKTAPRELILKPNQHVRLTAKDKFLISLGNAGGISFTLNGASLGVFGKRGKPLGNISIGRENLERASKPASQ